jgi:transcriptional regulator NrdR family protein
MHNEILPKAVDLCPVCKSRKTSIYSTIKVSPTYILRYHECYNCPCTFKTEEIVDEKKQCFSSAQQGNSTT